VRALRARAPAKLNLGLFIGPVRAGDGRHELLSVMQSLSLADELTLEPLAGAGEDELSCPGLAGPATENLAGRALAEFRRRTGWQEGPVRLRIEKRVPVAAGLAGGSADAAAALRLARAASGLGDEELLAEIAAAIGADVPAQLSPGRWLASGAGERLSALAPPDEPLAVLLLPDAGELSTAAVYAEADRLGLPRTLEQIQALRGQLERALAGGRALPAERALLANDLQPAALSLRPHIAGALEQALAAGAEHALLCGSGPTVAALFAGERCAERLAAAAASLGARRPAPIACAPVRAGFAAPEEVDAPPGASQSSAALKGQP